MNPVREEQTSCIILQLYSESTTFRSDEIEGHDGANQIAVRLRCHQLREHMADCRMYPRQWILPLLSKDFPVAQCGFTELRFSMQVRNSCDCGQGDNIECPKMDEIDQLCHQFSRMSLQPSEEVQCEMPEFNVLCQKHIQVAPQSIERLLLQLQIIQNGGERVLIAQLT